MANAEKKSIFKRWWFWTIIIIVIVALGNQDNNGTNSTSSNSTNDSANLAGIGDTVQTNYFEVTVNSLRFSKSVGSNEFTYVSAGEGNHFAIINVTYKNTDTEGRTLLAGEMIADYNGKKFTFDDAETVLEDGYILFETLNPLTKITGNVVFKMPEDVSQGLTYVPSRSKTKIKLN